MSKTILIVDDTAFVRETLAGILTAAGYRIVGQAANGSQAITLAASLRPDLITMDIAMPEISGIEAAKAILTTRPDIKIIMISGMNQEHLVMEAINAGARDYIVKPFDAEGVLKTIGKALE